MRATRAIPTILLLLAVSACTSDDGYDGCRGVGCTVDNLDRPRITHRTPRYDKNGYRNFDDDGNYIGCHGAGCLVDNPDKADDPNNWPLCSDGARHPDCSYAPEGY